MPPKGKNQHSVSMPSAPQSRHQRQGEESVNQSPEGTQYVPKPRKPPKTSPNKLYSLHYSGRHWHAVLILHRSLPASYHPTLLFAASPLLEGRRSLQAACPVCKPQPCVFWATSQPISSHLSTWAPNIRMPKSLFVLNTENTNPITFRIPIFAAVMHTDAFLVPLLWFQRNEDDQKSLPLLNIFGGRESEPSVIPQVMHLKWSLPKAALTVHSNTREEGVAKKGRKGHRLLCNRRRPLWGWGRWQGTLLWDQRGITLPLLSSWH